MIGRRKTWWCGSLLAAASALAAQAAEAPIAPPPARLVPPPPVATSAPASPPATPSAAPAPAASPRAAAIRPAALPETPSDAAASSGEALTLDDWIRVARQCNPELRQAGFEVQAAAGRAVQAGLYPNPTISAEGSELGNRNGSGGFVTAPIVTQEIITAGKRRLSREVGEQAVDGARWRQLARRIDVFTAVRREYFGLLAAQARVDIGEQLVRMATEATEVTETLVRAGQAAPLELTQIRVELNRFRAELDDARQQRTAAWRRLAAVAGVPDLSEQPVSGSLETPWPTYEFASAQVRLVESHPELRAARAEVVKAQLALRRARVEPVPNMVFGAGYERDNVDGQDQWVFRASVPLPLFNRNQGAIEAAGAELGRAGAEVDRVHNALIGRLATAFGQYSAACQRAERYRGSVLPDARQAYELALGAFRAGQLGYLGVLQAQRALAETQLEYTRALTELWQAAAEIAGLLVEEQWPPSA